MPKPPAASQVLRSQRRVALFGGSFDPPHRGHTTIAREAADRYDLDQVLFAPAGRQPLKPEGAWASFDDRLAMCELACSSDARFAVSTLDAPRPDGGANYTVLTLEALTRSEPGALLFNLVGGDSFLSLVHWREPQQLLRLAEWIVVSRPGVAAGDPAGMTLTEAQRRRIHWLPDVLEDVSATGLRQQLREGAHCAELLPPGVAEYIARHGLYRD